MKMIKGIDSLHKWVNQQMEWLKDYQPSKMTLGVTLGVACLLLAGSVIHQAEMSREGQVYYEVVESHIPYGISNDQLSACEVLVQPGMSFSVVLRELGCTDKYYSKSLEKWKNVIDYGNIHPGQRFVVYKNEQGEPKHIVYEPNIFRYFVADMGDAYTISMVEHPITVKEKIAEGVIESSLWNALKDGNYSDELADKLSDALAWTVDFHHVLKGDRFKMFYEQQYIDGNPVGVGEVKMALYEQGDRSFQLFSYDENGYDGYYSPDGRPAKSPFLKSPVKYSRISSGYNLNRRHPVLGYRRAHLGTDYAAPRGTPIYSVSDGTIVKAGYSRGNGNYVKIKHDNVYQTQYLHMQKIKKGIRPGIRVKQGDVIGFVGSTGLATGPHVCFRFWKNGKQVNHLRENLPAPPPMKKADLPAYYHYRDSLIQVIKWYETSGQVALNK